MRKQIKVSRTPDILILHLKRFDSISSKNDQLIQCPDDLTLSGCKFNLTRFSGGFWIILNFCSVLSVILDQMLQAVIIRLRQENQSKMSGLSMMMIKSPRKCPQMEHRTLTFFSIVLRNKWDLRLSVKCIFYFLEVSTSFCEFCAAYSYVKKGLFKGSIRVIARSIILLEISQGGPIVE